MLGYLVKCMLGGCGTQILFISDICMCDECCKLFFFLVTMNIIEKWKRNHRVFVLECSAVFHPGYLNVRTKLFVQ